MEKKQSLSRILTETIGIPQIITIVIGLPTMIIFIWSIWQALTFFHRVVAVISGALLLTMIILFVYFQTRKVLYVIPGLLYKMHSIVNNHASRINFISDLKEDDFFNAYRVINVDLTNMASVTTLAEFRTAIDIYYSQNKDKKILDEDTEKFSNYLMKKSGLLKQLDQDKDFMKILEKIKQLKLTIPSEDIMKAMNEFIKTSNSANGVLPLLQMIKMADKDLPEIVTPKIEAELIGISDRMDNVIAMSLTKVHESIGKYYRRVT
jgi:hypothetical protein